MHLSLIGAAINRPLRIEDSERKTININYEPLDFTYTFSPYEDSEFHRKNLSHC